MSSTERFGSFRFRVTCVLCTYRTTLLYVDRFVRLVGGKANARFSYRLYFRRDCILLREMEGTILRSRQAKYTLTSIQIDYLVFNHGIRGHHNSDKR